MKKITVKRFAMTSTAVLLSLSLLNTAPGVHIGVKPLSVVHASDTAEIKSQLADIFTIINADSILKSAYDTASGHIDTAVDAVDSSVLVKLKANNSGISGTQLAALRTLLNEAISYAKSLSTSHDSLPTSLVTAINTVNTQFSTSITAADTASFINTAKTNKINDLKTKTLAQIVGSDWNLANFLVDTVSTEITSSWSATNSFIAGIKTIYNTTNSADVTSDLTALKTALQAELAGEDTDLTNGGYAIAVAYLKNELKSVSSYTTTHTGQIHKVTAINISSINIPLEAFTWTATRSTLRTSPTEIEVDYSSQSSSGTAKLTGKFNPTYSAFAGLSAFNGVVLVDKDFTYRVSSTDTSPVTPPFTPSDGGTIVSGNATLSPILDIDAVHETLLLANTNAEKSSVVSQINQSLTSTLAISPPANNSSSSQANIILSSASILNIPDLTNSKSEALEALGENNLLVKATFSIDATTYSSSSVTITADIVAMLVASGIDQIEVKVNGASVTVPITSSNRAMNIEVLPRPSDQNNLGYSVKGMDLVSNSTGITLKMLVDNHFSTLINASNGFNAVGNLASTVKFGDRYVNPDHLVVAKVEGDKYTYIGGKYNPETDIMEVNIHEDGEYVIVEREVTFTDSNQLSWATAAINRGAVKGFYQGRGDGKFHVTANVTKAEFIAMLLRTQNLTATEDAKKALNYADVNKEQWYYTIAAAAVANGIVSAEDKQFNPNQIITREEMATLAANFLENVLFYNKNLTEVNVFKVDEKLIDPAHLQNVNFLASEGLVKGKAAGTFDPKGKVTRAEAAVIVDRIFGL